MARRPRPVRRTQAPVSPPEPPRPAPGPAPAKTTRRAWAAAGVLLVLHFALAVNSLVQENPTVDEVIHLPAGLTYWQKGTFKLYHHNPPLVRMIAALPVLGARVDMEAAYRSAYWRGPSPNKAGFAHEFALRNADRYFELFTQSRLVMPLFSIVGGMVVFAWSRRLYGDLGGLLSLTLWGLCPNILAHARLITTDGAATSIGLGATYLFWRFLKAPTWGRAALAGLALGVAELTKFSLIVFYAVWPALWLISVGAERDRVSRMARLRRGTLQGLAIAGLSFLVIDLGYAFEGVGEPLGRFDFLSASLTRPVEPPRAFQDTGNLLHDLARMHRINRFQGTSLANLPSPLPRHYLLGFDDQKLESEGIPLSWSGGTSGADDGNHGYPVYLDGKLCTSGWWYFYFLAIAYKVPEGTLALLALSLVVLAVSSRSRAPWVDELTVLANPLVVLYVMSVLTDINLGLRYVLPIFPYLFISAGKVVPWATGLSARSFRRLAEGCIGFGLLGTAAATVLVHPHYLAYFNWASGGPGRGSEHLIDSSLDWGQDLVGLQNWMRAHRVSEPIGIAYFGQINPNIFAHRNEGFAWFLPPALPGTMPVTPPGHQPGGPYERLRPGLYAVSASLLRGLPWRVYDPSRWAYYEAGMDAFRYFEELTPIDSVGHSIFLYRVTEADAQRLAHHWAGREAGRGRAVRKRPGSGKTSWRAQPVCRS